MLDAGIKFEFRHQLVNYDTVDGRSEFTVLNKNVINSIVISERTLMTCPIKINAGGGTRLNGL